MHPIMADARDGRGVSSGWPFEPPTSWVRSRFRASQGFTLLHEPHLDREKPNWLHAASPPFALLLCQIRVIECCLSRTRSIGRA